MSWIEVLSNGALCVEDMSFIHHTGYRQTTPSFTVNDLTANDYEIDEPQKVVKLSDMRVAWMNTFGALKDLGTHEVKLHKQEQFTKITKQLGIHPAEEKGV
jgi:hypothetical protein